MKRTKVIVAIYYRQGDDDKTIAWYCRCIAGQCGWKSPDCRSYKSAYERAMVHGKACRSPLNKSGVDASTPFGIVVTER